MENRRFTVRIDGVAYIKNADGTILSGDAIDCLAAYEDTGLEPEEITALKEAEQKRRQGGEDCKSGFYMTNNVQHPQYKWCPKCGRDLRGESHDGD